LAYSWMRDPLDHCIEEVVDTHSRSYLFVHIVNGPAHLSGCVDYRVVQLLVIRFQVTKQVENLILDFIDTA